MNELTLLNQIDGPLLDLFAGAGTVQLAGRVESIYDPQARRPVLMRRDQTTGKPARLTVDTFYDVQIGHRLTGGQPIKSPTQFGSRANISFDLQWTLICATRRADLLPSVLMTFARLSAIDVREFNTDTLSVLKNEWLYVPSQNVPYDPLIQCFAIKYTMQNISDQLFANLCTPSLQNE